MLLIFKIIEYNKKHLNRGRLLGAKYGETWKNLRKLFHCSSGLCVSGNEIAKTSPDVPL